MFRSRINEAAKQAGRTVVAASKSGDVLEKAVANRPGVIVVDLGDERIEPFETIRALKARDELAGAVIIGFYPHLRTDLLEAARAAGCDVVLTRFAFSSKLPHLFETQLDARDESAG